MQDVSNNITGRRRRFDEMDYVNSVPRYNVPRLEYGSAPTPVSGYGPELDDFDVL